MDAHSNHGSTGQLSNASGIGPGGMHHSLSTPAGVDGGGSRTPPPTPKKGGKMLAIRIQMLDDTVTIFQIQAKAIGKVLFDQVCKQLHLLEADYFGLEYADTGGTKYWLDLQKPLSRQLGLSLVDPLLYFCVKFYTPDPGQLEEEFTRYLFCLQVKRDLAQGVMQCNENTAALMASYIVQAECGDFVTEDYPDHTYLSTFKFVPSQDHEMERRIMENHKKHAGQSPAEADLNLLETARRCELYGIKMHPAKDHENIPLNLAVAHMGILVFQNYTKINTFSWAKIRKISFKRKRFLIKLHPEGYGFYKDAVEFLFEGRNECKNFWKKCVENHGFFRCSSVKNVSRHKTRVLSRGSSFRYSGKTQKQIIEFVRDNYVKRQAFQRSASFRHSSAHSSATNMHSNTVGNSISAHPLLPLADANLSVEAAKLSASLGSTGWSAAAADRPASPTTKPAYRHRVTPTTWSSDSSTTTTNQRSTPQGERTETRLPAPPKMTSTASSPPTTRSPSPESSPIATSRTRSANIDDRKKTGSLDARRPQYSSPHRDVHEAAVHKTDTDNNKVKSLSFAEKLNGSHLSQLNNNLSYLTSTPTNRTPNEKLSDLSLNATNGHYELEKADKLSPIRNYNNEQLMNSLNANNDISGITTTIIADIEGEVKKKHKFVEKGYYMAKEIYMTEITYKKDLDVINVWFRDDVGRLAVEECESLLTLIKPLAEAHGSLLKDLENRIHGWDCKGGWRSSQGKIADVLLAHLPPLISLYQEYMDEHINVLENLDVAFKQNPQFEQTYREFETQKVCYLPFTTFVLRPLHRLIQYRSLIDRLLKYYGPNHPDRSDCLTVANCLKAIIDPVPEILEESENISTLCELQKDIVGFDNLYQPGRKFIRQGCLLKYSKKGYQQRMFFLFSDILLYTSRSQATLQFRVHGHMPLRGVLIEEPEGELANCGFIIYGGSRSLIVAANSHDDKERWKTDLKAAIQEAKDKSDTKTNYLSLKSYSSSEELIDHCGNDVGTQTKATAQRSNTTVHVCWHRSTSTGMKDELLVVENQLSGFLLRKFKSSNGWQKLWVVFTNFCLFFYKGCFDEFPLASLPLLGYTIGLPTVEDAIYKDFVFKLQYKNHVYFFRSESEYTFNRWMEVISNITQSKLKKKLAQLVDEDSIQISPEK
ncbi:FERM, ARHGEF and pleckstrin domain-containing protein 2 isoform X1 [Coccinella septempunctata]|uniref:FERM, ARHGEF and pleckstrin domain-containing protein 2 isoform X1 n=1 Tax=Coccinella septempunctata TaxID=41139 RepID=UPI001D08F195|nr:FERM, ARHGEF and pleckstrin domain-containing protein 2 isoform X1 [Coccinella septempunctata]XP_044752125.1 FERM, ARHGEF and pleckstrin domain-containing protein 2 isoform X1 [Coccinella septempunctata]